VVSVRAFLDLRDGFIECALRAGESGAGLSCHRPVTITDRPHGEPGIIEFECD
jgi:hypothetical protein